MRFHDEITKAPPLRRAGTRANVLDSGSPLPLCFERAEDRRLTDKKSRAASSENLNRSKGNEELTICAAFFVAFCTTGSAFRRAPT